MMISFVYCYWRINENLEHQFQCNMRAKRALYLYNENMPVKLLKSIKTLDLCFFKCGLTQKLSHTEIPKMKRKKKMKWKVYRLFTELIR